ncbi:bifunctional adenosylcobinamide kinase/adenosylcobinamide-phosphate guanylyltransferase [Phycicoccus sp. CSK15P-2]|uniref:bifunctional adenosylcobinamide kinase/adenosylcobinamide-phosphate guanylyltransferase n=1 Tax=Phycicoccus sp. CSK15P-2 TaxID=2807627 RepID=UPI001952531C|nr:bifunctional adenosylcobinamide kinase/adenosylcobinamide-phosphate guanylyltransferase [Phycicoccus sp. CSK15P-2]MBM6404220.1 bifunctional adenosylcobinamide kinase/adenosylcobinamide-phosphate guanylyltransferase [Phycicoccus sp. CSK15P-2]
MRTLVTGGVRSGKSHVAEGLFDAREGVTYVATGPRADDPDWADRVAAHRARRPASWSTLETSDLAGALAGLTGPALVDCAGTWLTSVLDDLGAWDAPRADWVDALHERTDAVVAAWAGCPHDVVLVTNEVGWGVVPAHRSGRVFADELGRLNQDLAAVSDTVLLVVAGRVLPLPGP